MPSDYRAPNSWLGINPGLLRHTVTIQQQTVGSPPTFDDAGPVLTWAIFATRKAHIETLRASDAIKAGQDVSKLWTFVTIRYLAGLTPAMRLIAPNGSTYVIQGIENVNERNLLMRLSCLALGENQ